MNTIEFTRLIYKKICLSSWTITTRKDRKEIIMQEAEVSIRLAMYFIENEQTNEDVKISIDGAHIKTGETIHFPIWKFLGDQGCIKLSGDADRWQGVYQVKHCASKLIITSEPGNGDVTAKLKDGRMVYAECKKGRSDKKGQEYPLMREAIGQLITSKNFNPEMIPMVGVPYSEKSYELAVRWSTLSQIDMLGIKFALIKENGSVEFI